MSKITTDNVGIVILAAGDGSRMKSNTPKVMSLLHNKPLVAHVMDNVEAAECASKTAVVVCKNHTLVQDCLGDRAVYPVQKEQLGTGHAAAAAQSVLENNVDHVMVLYGDMPFLTPASIQRLAQEHVEKKNKLTLMTVTVPHFDEPYEGFYHFGRIIRGEHDGQIERIVERKDATEEERTIRELNPSYFCFHAEWLWDHVTKLKNNNVQQEYYLTDLLQMAIDEGERISSIPVDPKEAVGVNTKEDLLTAHTI